MCPYKTNDILLQWKFKRYNSVCHQYYSNIYYIFYDQNKKKQQQKHIELYTYRGGADGDHENTHNPHKKSNIYYTGMDTLL